MTTIPAFTIGGITRPELHLDPSGNIVLDPAAQAFAAVYGLKGLYLGCPPGTPWPPVTGFLSTPVDSNATANSVAEGAPADTPVNLTAHADSLLGFPVTYSLTSDSSGGGFKINAATGVVSVADPTKIDFESSAGHAHTVTVFATDGIFSSSQTFTIGVSDVAPATPTDTNAAANTVTEGAAAGTLVGITVSAPDVNGGAVSYSLSNNAGGAFKIDATTGVVSVADPTKIDFESSGPSHSYTITAVASDGTLTSSQNFTIAVADVPLPVPTDINAAANAVAEGAAAGTLVGITASAVDPNGPTSHYSLTADSSNGGLKIDPTTGVVTVLDPTKIDFESAPGPGHTYSITVTANDGVATTSSSFTIAVTDVPPSTPVDSDTAHANTIFENDPNGTAVGITAFSVDPPNPPGNLPPVTYSLTDSAGGRFAIDPNTGVVTIANSTLIDYETAPGHAYSITVQAQAGASSSTQQFSIGVSNVNEAPSGADKTVTTNEDSSYVFTEADFGFSDPADSSAPNTLLAVKITTLPSGGTLTDNGNPVSAGSFISIADITGGHLVFTPAADANGSPEASFTFQVQDNGGTAHGGVDTDPTPNTITINVTPVNDAPSFTVGPTQNVLEDAGPQTVVGFATGISPGPANEAGQTVSFVVTNDSNAGLFAVGPSIAGDGTLTYTTAANASGSATITVHAHDNGGTANGGIDNSADQTFTINVGSVNDAPSGADKTITTLEDTSYTFTVADFGFSDPNDSPANNLTAVKITTLPAGGTLTDNGNPVSVGSFIAVSDITAGHLVFSPNANANGSPETFFTFQVQDDGGTANGGVDTDPTPNTISFNVTSVNDAPAGADKTVGASGAYTFAVADFGFTDPADAGSAAGANALQAVEITTAPTSGTLTDNGSVVTAGTFVSVAEITAGHLVFTPTGNSRASFTFQVQDNGGTANGGVDTDPTPRSFTINQDLPPTVTAGHTLGYTENQAAIAIDPAITVADPDSLTLVSAKVQISGNFVPGQDVLGFTDTASIHGSFNSATGILTLTGIDTVANYQAALASVTYFNSSDNPSPLARTVTITANDGTLDSAPATDTINVTPVNDAPVVVAGHTLGYTENQAATAIDPAITVNDVDSANLTGATVQITGNYANGQDILAFVNTGTITGTFNGGTGTLTLTGTDTVANYQAALQAVTYFNNSDNPSGLARTVTVIATDGITPSTAVTDTINVTPINDPPVTANGSSIGYLENQAATAIDTALTISDVDNTTLSSARVAITGGFSAGEDVLSFVTQNGISGSYNAATGVLTLSGSSSVANYQAALRSVTYSDSSDNPSAADRTVSYTVNDGAADSNATTSTIHVTPVNDAPVVTFGALTGFTEPPNGTPAANSVPVTIAPNLTITDVDSANLTDVTFVLNDLKPADALSVSGHAGTTGTIGNIGFTISSTATTETVHFTGTDTVAHYNAALDLIQFNNTSENPDTTARSYTVTAVDDGGTANGGNNTGSANASQTVTAVNDAPTQTVPLDSSIGTAFSHTNLAISGLSVADVDASSGNVTATIAAGHAALSFDTTGLVSFTNNGAHTVTLTGTIAQVNTALATLTYNSDDGFVGSDTVTLSVNDNGNTGTPGAQTSTTGTFHVGVVPQVFYIDNTNAGPGNGAGTAADPYHSIAAFNTANPAASGDYVVLKHGTGTYSETNGINLNAGVNLIGGSEDLQFTNPVTGAIVNANVASGTNPVIHVTGADNGIDLTGGGGHIIQGVDVDTSASTGIGISDDNNNVGTVALKDLTVHTAGGAGIVFAHGGTVTATGTNHITTTTGTALNITNTTIGSGNLTFHDISSNGALDGIVLNATGTSGGLIVTGDGGSSNNGSGGTIQNTSSYGISLINTQNVSFDQVNISNTNASGVNGVGVTNFTYTDGTITGAGTANADSAIAFNGDPVGASGGGHNIDGALTITGNIFTNSFHSGVDVQSDNGTVTNANISNNTITNPGFSGVDFVGLGTANSAFSLNNAQIANNNISSSGGNGIQISIGNAATGTTATAHAGFVTFDGLGRPISDPNHIISITGNSITLDSGGTQAITVTNTTATTDPTHRTQTNFEILNNGTLANPITGSSIGTDILIGNNGNSDMAGVIDHNVIVANHTPNGGGGNGIAGGNGVAGAGNAWTPKLDLAVTNNTISGTDGNGILLVGRGTSGEADLKIADNDVGAPVNAGGTAREGIRVDAGNAASGDDAVFLDIFGNTSAGSNGASGIGLRKQGTVGTTNDFGIYDGAGGPSLSTTPTNTDITNFVNALNPGSADGGAFGTGGTDIINGSNFLRDATRAPPLLAAAGGVQASTPTPGEGHLTQAELDPIVAAAIALWQAAGASQSQLNLLHATQVTVGGLSGGIIGEQTPGHVIIDASAAGHGWFVDPTPLDNSEFTQVQNAGGTDLLTTPSNAAAGHLDLLTTVTHELGHVLGLDDTTAPGTAHDLMYISLVDGERRLPNAADVAQANGATSSFQAIGGTVPPAQAASTAPAPAPVTSFATASPSLLPARTVSENAGFHFGGGLPAWSDYFVFNSPSGAAMPVLPGLANTVNVLQAHGFDFSALQSQFHTSALADLMPVHMEDLGTRLIAASIDTGAQFHWDNLPLLGGAAAGAPFDNHLPIPFAQNHVDFLV